MNRQTTIPVEQRLRTFLLFVAGGICVGTVIELALTEHYKTLVQGIPFVLCVLGGLAIAAALLRPQRQTLLALRIIMGLLVIGSLVGIYQHLSSNVLFELDMRPGVAWTSVFFIALKGAAPLLAPGILALAGILAGAATYEHPAVSSQQSAVSSQQTKNQQTRLDRS